MIQGKSSQANINVILSLIKQEDIFERYLGMPVQYVRHTTNPLRQGDDNVTCSFKNYGKYIIFRDFIEERSWNCFELVKRYYNCDYDTALQKIVEDFKLVNSEVKNVKNFVTSELTTFSSLKKEVNLRIKRIPFTKQHIEYWKQYHLNQEDLDDDVFAIKCFWFNEQKNVCKTPSFAYHWGGYDYKLYFPFVKKGEGIRFYHNDASIIQGERHLKFDKSVLIITSSYKDVKCIRKTIKLYDLDFEVVAPMSETTPISKEKIEFYKSKYNYLVLYHNNDKAGIDASIRQAELYNCDYIVNPEETPKDYSDWIKSFNNEKEAYSFGSTILQQLIYDKLPPL